MAPNPLFQRISMSRGSAGSNRLKDGIFELTVTAVLFKSAEKKEAENDSLIFEFVVDKSEDVPGAFYIGDKAAWETDPGAKMVGANKPGDTPGVVLVFSGDRKHKSSMGNAKTLVCALLGADENEVMADGGEDLANTIGALVAKDNPGRGRRIRASSYRKPIKTGENAGKPCVSHKWEYVEQTAEEIASRRAELDKVKPEEKSAA